MSYMIMSFFIWLIMTQVGIMTSLTPLAGETSIFALVKRYSSKSLGLTAGYNLYYAQAMIVPVECTTASLVCQYWTSANVAIFISVFIFLSIAINCFPVKVFGEVEFWVASIKLLCLVGLIILGIVIFFGGTPGQHGVQGFRYWNTPGAFVEHLSSGNTGKFLSVWTAIIKSGFSFVLVPELLASSFGEIQNARKNIKICCKQFVYRLGIFYILSMLIVGTAVAYNNPRLLSAVDSGTTNASASPFVIAAANINVLPHIVNACILTAAASAGYGLFYSATRVLYSMARAGDAPKIFAKVNRFGVPMYSVGVTSLFGPLAYLNCSNSASNVFNWLSNIATISGFVSWVIISITFIRFCKVIDYHKLNSRLPYNPPYQLIGAYASTVFFTLLTLTNGYAVFINGNWSVDDFFTSYVTLIIVAVLYIGSVIYYKEYKQFFFKPEDVRIEFLIERADEEEENDIIQSEGKKPWWTYIFFFIA